MQSSPSFAQILLVASCSEWRSKSLQCLTQSLWCKPWMISLSHGSAAHCSLALHPHGSKLLPLAAKVPSFTSNCLSNFICPDYPLTVSKSLFKAPSKAFSKQPYLKWNSPAPGDIFSIFPRFLLSISNSHHLCMIPYFFFSLYFLYSFSCEP